MTAAKERERWWWSGGVEFPAGLATAVGQKGFFVTSFL
ncbi:hypothetical protein A2U01_0035606 [Trifolium medium]|uniref:Uncharacterized protein n=1 Tax=Trifolium medium TaxID=97028 RepID=A0A392PU70_9FABA|nr:hypothetical protein [Trifolium medium]